MKHIPLTNSDEKAIVDDENYEFIMQFEWRYEDGFAVTGYPPVEMGYLIMNRKLREESAPFN